MHTCALMEGLGLAGTIADRHCAKQYCTAVLRIEAEVEEFVVNSGEEQCVFATEMSSYEVCVASLAWPTLSPDMNSTSRP